MFSDRIIVDGNRSKIEPFDCLTDNQMLCSLCRNILSLVARENSKICDCAPFLEFTEKLRSSERKTHQAKVQMVWICATQKSVEWMNIFRWMRCVLARMPFPFDRARSLSLYFSFADCTLFFVVFELTHSPSRIFLFNPSPALCCIVMIVTIETFDYIQCRIAHRFREFCACVVYMAANTWLQAMHRMLYWKTGKWNCGRFFRENAWLCTERCVKWISQYFSKSHSKRT